MKLYLTEITDGRYITAVKGVRLAKSTLGLVPASLREAKGVVDALAEDGTPQLVGEGDEQPCAVALAQLEEHDCHGAFDLTPEDIAHAAQQPASDPEEDEADATYTGCKTALALMAFADGSPNKALMFARTLQINTGDEALYDEVATILMDTFPPPPDMRVG